jgi:hypothetical protein
MPLQPASYVETPLDFFMTGLIVMGFWVAGLFFLRFWRDTHDRLFLSFCLAFWLLGVNRAGLAVSEKLIEPHTWFFLVRLLAYVLIILAILEKNRARGRGT